MTRKKLGEIADIFTGVRIERFKKGNTEIKPVIKNKMADDNISLEFELEEITKGIDDKYISKKGDILISLSFPNNVVRIEEDGFVIPSFFSILRLKDGYDAGYVFNALKSSYFKRELHKYLAGTSIRTIKIDDLRKIKLFVPEYEKQVKYGEFFDLMYKRTILLNQQAELNEKRRNKLMTDLLNKVE